MEGGFSPVLTLKTGEFKVGGQGVCLKASRHILKQGHFMIHETGGSRGLHQRPELR
jgi:hypothetical protein